MCRAKVPWVACQKSNTPAFSGVDWPFQALPSQIRLPTTMTPRDQNTHLLRMRLRKQQSGCCLQRNLFNLELSICPNVIVQRKICHFLLVGGFSQYTVNRVLKKHHPEITDGQEPARPALEKSDRMASRGIFHSKLFCASLKWWFWTALSLSSSGPGH